MAYALGIDIGTSYTAAAVWRHGRAEMVTLGGQAHSIPSALFLREDGVMLVGEVANQRGAAEPDRVAREFKRRFGDRAPLLLGDTQVTSADLTGYLLRWVVDKVSEHEGERPAHVTLTAPATWGEYRRQLMTAAAATARLTDVGLLLEPVAAAAYYASHDRLDPESLLAMYDLGGGTFDATVVRKTDNGFAVEGTPGGDDSIGGADFDQVVIDHVATTLGVAWFSFDTDEPAVLAGLAQVRAQAVAAKEALSTDVDATIAVILPGLTRAVRITRGEFESAIRILVLRTVDTLTQTITTAGVEPADLHSVLLVGGSSRIPLVSRLIAGELGVPVAVDTHPKYAVCIGAAISAGSRLHVETHHPAGPPRTSARPTSERTVTISPVQAPTGDPAVDGAELLVPDAEPVPTLAVDLQRAGITEPLDLLLRPVPDVSRAVPRLTGHDEPLTVAHTGDPQRGRRMVLLVSAGSGLLLIAASALGAWAVSGRVDQPPVASIAPTPVPTTMPAKAPAATLLPQEVPSQAGDVMRAIATMPGGDLLSVGGSTTDQVPRAWRYSASKWSRIPGPGGQTDGSGQMNGVAGAGKIGLVAVGWTAPRTGQLAPATARRAAIWISTDGRAWKLLPPPVAATGAPLGELLDVATRPGGGFLATGIDWSADPGAGDGAVLASSDGQHWRTIEARGLDGPGPATLRRLLPGPAAAVTAIGTRLEGSTSRSVMWTSPDSAHWSVAGSLESDDSTLGSAWGLTRSEGILVAAGFRVRADGKPEPVLWTGSTASSMAPHPVSGTAEHLYGVAAVKGTVVAIGSLSSEGSTKASAWTVRLP